MDSKKIGNFIMELRKEKGMTQQELGDKLNVTNKAVSKWETGSGYPEITIIHTLAEILEVTTSELLNGERNAAIKEIAEESATPISEAFKNNIKTERPNKANASIVIISIIFSLACFICLLCDFILNQSFSWSLYPTGALVFLWLTIIPLIKLKKHKVEVALSIFITSLTLYLFLIQSLVPVKGWVVPLAIPIAISSLLAVYIVIALCIYTKVNKLYITAIFVALFGIGINLIVERIVISFARAPQESYSFIVALASTIAVIILAAMGYIMENKAKYK